MQQARNSLASGNVWETNQLGYGVKVVADGKARRVECTLGKISDACREEASPVQRPG